MDTKEIKQINLKLSPTLVQAAESYARNFGFRNIQELTATAVREKIFFNNQFDETFSQNEIEIVDKLTQTSIKNNDFTSEEELNKILAE